MNEVESSSVSVSVANGIDLIDGHDGVHGVENPIEIHEVNEDVDEDEGSSSSAIEHGEASTNMDSTEPQANNPDPDDNNADVEKGKVGGNIQATNSIFSQIESQAKSCANLIEDWIEKVKSGEVSTDKGLAFLEVKNHTLLNYLVSLTGLIMNKASGISIQGSSYLDQLIESRIVLERIRPIDQKLKYQIDKLVRIAVDGKVETNDPLMYKANLDNLTSGSKGGDSDVELDDQAPTSTTTATKSGGIYRPPKVVPQHYDEEMPKGKGPKEDRKRPEVNRTLIRELQEEYLDTPVEVHNMGDAYVKQLSREIRDKQRFEESYMTRLPVTKREKHKERSASTLGALGDELTDFTGKRARSDGANKGKKKKSKGKGRGGSKKRFRK